MDIKKNYKLIPVLSLLLGILCYFAYQHINSYDAETISGEKLSWHDKQGTWLVVNFFAQWCAPCLREIPELNQFYSSRGEGVDLYMVSFDPLDKARLSEIVEKHEISVPVIITNEKTRLPIPYPSGLPATYIITPEGKMAKEIMGEIKATELQALLNKMQSQHATTAI